MNIADKLVIVIQKKKSPVCIGLDPVIDRIPSVYFSTDSSLSKLDIIAKAIYDFNKDIIDAVKDIVPCVKPQSAFYEMYGAKGILAFEKTIQYAKSQGLFVIADAKRNDIGNTAMAYANAYLGKVSLLGTETPMYDVDFLTVSPYLGKESLLPFIDECKKYNKGIFILVKTSNPGNEDIQDAPDKNNIKVHERVAGYVNTWSREFQGVYNYSSIGAVVGATYPKEAQTLRERMPKSFFLVPGYGAQGGTAEDIAPCFNGDGLGAIVSASRSILYGYETINKNCTKGEYKAIVRDLTKKMVADIYKALKKYYKLITY